MSPHGLHLIKPVPLIRDQKEVMTAFNLPGFLRFHLFQLVASINRVPIIQAMPCFMRAALRTSIRIILLVLGASLHVRPDGLCLFEIKERFLVDVISVTPVLSLCRRGGEEQCNG